MTGPHRPDGSRVEAAEAGVHAELAEAERGRDPEEHVTAADAATVPELHAPAGAGHMHHPPDPNAGVVRGRVGRGAVLAGTLAAGVTILAVVLFALKIGGS